MAYTESSVSEVTVTVVEPVLRPVTVPAFETLTTVESSAVKVISFTDSESRFNDFCNLIFLLTLTDLLISNVLSVLSVLVILLYEFSVDVSTSEAVDVSIATVLVSGIETESSACTVTSPTAANIKVKTKEL